MGTIVSSDLVTSTETSSASSPSTNMRAVVVLSLLALAASQTSDAPNECACEIGTPNVDKEFTVLYSFSSVWEGSCDHTGEEGGVSGTHHHPAAHAVGPAEGHAEDEDGEEVEDDVGGFDVR